MRLRPSLVAQTSVRHRQRIVDHRRVAVERQRLLEMPRGSSVILFAQRRTSKPVMRRGRARLERHRFREERFGGVRPSLIERRLPEPGHRRHVARCQPQRPFERDGRLRDVAFLPVQVTEIVRPGHRARCERLRVEKRGFCRIEEFGRQQAAFPSRHIQSRGRWQPFVDRLASRSALRGARATAPGPIPRAREIRAASRFLSRMSIAPTRPPSGACSRRTATRRTGSRLSPAFALLERRVSIDRNVGPLLGVPPGHSTRTLLMLGVSPRPTSTLGSLADA